MSWIQLILKPKNKLILAHLYVKKTSWFQLILKPENELILKLWKWADFSCFWSQESELILADFEAKKPNWL